MFIHVNKMLIEPIFPRSQEYHVNSVLEWIFTLHVKAPIHNFERQSQWREFQETHFLYDLKCVWWQQWD